MQHTLNVLLIEDKVEDSDLIIREFKKHNIDCNIFLVNDEEGLIQALKNEWDVIISDYILPRLSCVKVLEILRDRLNLDIPFIVVSDTVGEDLAVRVMKLGANDYIMKDNLKRLIPAVQREIREAKNRLEKRLADEELKKKKEELEEINKQLQERIKKEVEISREKDYLIEKQARFMLISDILSRIAHQWRQPLNVIALILQEIEYLLPADSDIKKTILNRIELGMERVNYLSGIIDKFYNFFLPDTQKIRFNVIDAINNAITLIENSLSDAGITLILNLKDKDLYVYGFYKEYSHTVLNILTNSYEAIIKRNVSMPFISITTLLEDDSVKTIIRDNAGGIENEIIDRIFEPYYTTKFEGEGVGLGLYISKIMIEKNMNGKITLSNTSEGVQCEIVLKYSK